ncbi:MAG: DUF3422 family protein [Devosiaceae bacterium]
MAQLTSNYRKHPQFDAAARATHSRPALPVKAPAEINHAIILAGEANQASDHARFVDAIEGIGWQVVQDGGGEVLAVKERSTIKWERHTEFISLTAVAGEKLGNTETSQAFEATLEALTSGENAASSDDVGVLSRTRVLVGMLKDELNIPRQDVPIQRVLVVGDGIEVSTTLLHDQSQMVEYRATLLDDEAKPMSPRRVGRFVQRLIEIESYRLLAYLAVPMMQLMGPRVSALEAQVNEIAQRAAADPKPDEEQAILTELTNLSAELQSIGSDSEFRFAASLAYSAIVDERLESLRESRIEGSQRISTAVKRRLDPAMRSCNALLRRQQKIAERISYVTDLLRTRVDLALQDQNAAVLQSIDQRAKAQLRLQQAVEGLSVAAITYYTLGILYYLVKGSPVLPLGMSADAFQALFVIPTAVLVYWGLRRVRARNEAADDDVDSAL